MSSYLTIGAGTAALRIIKDRGLRPEDVSTITGAAGGPKWLVLAHLDRYLFSEFFRDRTEPLALVGASIGAWRFAALSQQDPLAALDRFQQAYVHQAYDHRPTAAEVTEESQRILNAYLDDDAIAYMLAHPVCRHAIMTVRCRGWVASEKKFPLALGLGLAALTNGIHRKLLGLFFERALFHHPEDREPFPGMDLLPIHRIKLTPDNFRSALLASGSIPFVMAGIPSISGAPPGMYRDGGITDYHLDIPFSRDLSKLVLFPHYMPRIIPGWFDKKLTWRKPCAANMANVVMVSPSLSFIDKLPYRKIPDRSDFWLFENKDQERFNYWLNVVAESKQLADAFQEAVVTGRIRDMVQPMDTRD